MSRVEAVESGSRFQSSRDILIRDIENSGAGRSDKEAEDY